MSEVSRPLDALNEARNKRVIIDLKNSRQYVGRLKAFDIHINIATDNTKEIVDGEVKRNLSLAFVRGNTILYITPGSTVKKDK